MEIPASLTASVRAFILEAFLFGEDSDELTSDTHLVEQGVVNSINVLQLVEFMEETYDIMLEPQELHELISISNIANVIATKQAE